MRSVLILACVLGASASDAVDDASVLLQNPSKKDAAQGAAFANMDAAQQEADADNQEMADYLNDKVDKEMEAKNEFEQNEDLELFTNREEDPEHRGVWPGSDSVARIPGDIPRIFTPRNFRTCGFGGSQEERPSQFLRHCMEVGLPTGIPDLRGEWEGNHVELASYKYGKHHEFRIEQCEDRIIISNHDSVRDFVHADGSFDMGVNDWKPATLPQCRAYRAAGRFQRNCFTIFTGKEAKREKFCMNWDGTLEYKFGEDSLTNLTMTKHVFPTKKEEEGHAQHGWGSWMPGR